MSTYDTEIKVSTNPEEVFFNFNFTNQINFANTSVSDDIIIIDDVLSEDECDEIKKLVDVVPPSGFKSKICIKFTELSNLILTRCKNIILQEVFVKDSTTSSNLWSLKEINPNWRIVKCNPGAKLSQHYDGVYVKSVDEKSIYTIMIYLENSDGNLKFLKSQIKPQKGRLVVFNQKLLHEGMINTETKYFIRSEIMYERETKIETSNDKKAMELYVLGYELNKLAETEKAEKLEKEAFELSPMLERLVLNL